MQLTVSCYSWRWDMLDLFLQRQTERRKRDQQYKERQRPRGDDAEPNINPDDLFSVSQLLNN